MDAIIGETVASQTRRRRELQIVLNPSGAITYPHLGRAVDLALYYWWTVAPADEHQVGIKGYSHQATRTIYTMPIRGDAELALFVHEGGHLEDQDADNRRHSHRDGARMISIEAEVVAWRFAMRRLGWRWNRTMQDSMVVCLQTYGTYIETPDERHAVEALIADGHDQARHVVRIQPRPVAL
jgi:hypothetical protein